MDVASDSIWLLFQGDKILLEQSQELLSPLRDTTLSSLSLPLNPTHLLGNLEGTAYYCAEIPKNTIIPPELNLAPYPIREALIQLEEKHLSFLSKGSSIILWDKTHQFCGQCGQATHLSQAFERQCQPCNLLFYPRINPAIVVLVKRQKSILMARSPHFKENYFGLIAGFVEAGESMEETVHREVFEEVGIQIKNLQYVNSQYWPPSQALMLAFTAEHALGEINIDPQEIEAAGWYTSENMPLYFSNTHSITAKLIRDFLEQNALAP